MDLSFQNIISEYDTYFTFIVIFCVLILERLIPIARGQKLLRKELGHDVILMCIVESSAISMMVDFAYRDINREPIEYFTQLPFIAKLSIYAFLDQMAIYWVHRTFHKINFLWECHKVHHSTKVLDVFVYYRTHWLMEVSLNVALIYPLAKLGFNEELFYTYFIIERIFGVMMHANINFEWPGFLKYIFVSPYFHRVHHTKKHCQKNFAGMLSILDLAFGTFEYPDDAGEMELGFKGEENYHKNIFMRQLHPFLNIFKISKLLKPKTHKTNQHSKLEEQPALDVENT